MFNVTYVCDLCFKKITGDYTVGSVHEKFHLPYGMIEIRFLRDHYAYICDNCVPAELQKIIKRGDN